MLVKFMGLAAIAIFLNSCAKGGSDSPAAPAIIGFDYSGTYIGNKIECYNSALTVMTTYAAITSGQSSIVINKNSQSGTQNAGACVVQYSGTIEFMPNAVLNIPSQTITSATGGGCTAITTLSNAPANTVTPASRSVAYSTGQVQAALMGAGYIRNPTSGDIGVLSVYKNSADNNDLCFLILTKQ